MAEAKGEIGSGGAERVDGTRGVDVAMHPCTVHVVPMSTRIFNFAPRFEVVNGSGKATLANAGAPDW